LQLKAEKDHGKDVTNIQPFKYDLGTSLKKFYLAIIMHEYPFNIVEHDYFVDFLKSLRPSFAFKSRVTARKDIMDIHIEEKDNATMDVWTSCQNKSYMCVTLHWIDDAWKIQKRIVALFHLEGQHTGHRLAEAVTEVFVKWFVEKKIFALCHAPNRVPPSPGQWANRGPGRGTVVLRTVAPPPPTRSFLPLEGIRK
jgi:hypothetical protein